MTLEQLRDVLNSQFAPPFLPADYVRARFVKTTGERTLQINIGRRDIWLTEDGRVIGAGTMLAGCAPEDSPRA